MPKIIDHEQRRRDIVEVAKKLILHGGFEAATMRSIASEAGFANGALKHYFEGKDQIVAATFESVLAELSSGVRQQEDGDPVEQLRGYLEASFPLDLNRIASARVLLALWEHATSNPELAELYRQFLSAWRSELVARIRSARPDAGPTAPESDDALATQVISSAIGSNVIGLMYPGGESIADYQQFLDDFVKRVAPGV